MEETYPVKVIDHFLADIKTDLTEIKTSTATSIDNLANTIKTHNGRLSRVEQFMWAFGGGMAVVTCLVLPYLFYYNATLQNKVDNLTKTSVSQADLDSRVQSAISNSLSNKVFKEVK